VADVGGLPEIVGGRLPLVWAEAAGTINRQSGISIAVSDFTSMCQPRRPVLGLKA
jgi:hypothetical protein